MGIRRYLLIGLAAFGVMSLAWVTTSCTGTTRGAAFGTAAGAIIGNQFGSKGKGAAIGGVTGALIGNSRDYRARQNYYYGRPRTYQPHPYYHYY